MTDFSSGADRFFTDAKRVCPRPELQELIGASQAGKRQVAELT
jgi:hypothetical protein